MLTIQLKNIYKRYQSDWIIDDFSYHFKPNTITGISGLNGKGKSTLLKIIAGLILPSKGELIYHINDQIINEDQLYKYFSFSAPYMSLFEELTAVELFNTIARVKSLQVADVEEFVSIAMLGNERDKLIKYYSSGMQQRLNLALTILSEMPLLVLDEPTSYLDVSVKKWFDDLLAKYGKNKTIIIASNDPFDFSQCRDMIEL